MKVLSQKIVFKSKFFRVEQKVIERNGKTFTKDFIERNPAIFILPVGSDGDIYLINQYRDTFRKTTLEVIAGMMEHDKDPLEAAKRELEEEIGLIAKSWKQLITWELSVNMNAKIHVFVATDLQEGKQHLDDDEVIERVKMSLEKALEKVETGEIVAASHAAILLLFDKLKKEGKI